MLSLNTLDHPVVPAAATWLLLLWLLLAKPLSRVLLHNRCCASALLWYRSIRHRWREVYEIMPG